MMPLYTDTTCNRDASITTSEGMYSLLEEENPRVMEVKATETHAGRPRHQSLNLHVHSFIE